MCLLFQHHPYFEFFVIFVSLVSILTFYLSLLYSITASCSFERHIVALESDPIIFNALLLSMRDPQPAHTSRLVAPPSIPIFDPP